MWSDTSPTNQTSCAQVVITLIFPQRESKVRELDDSKNCARVTHGTSRACEAAHMIWHVRKHSMPMGEEMMAHLDTSLGFAPGSLGSCGMGIQ